MSGENAVAKLAQARMDGVNIAEGIQTVAEAGILILSSGLTERALVALLHDLTKVGKRDIKLILDALPELKEVYLKGPTGD